MRLIVVGGGAAGFFCAVTAARLNPSLKVSVVERSNKLLSKVRISGGGRCNVTHACFSIEEMSRSYPRGQHFVKKTFHEFFTKDTIRWFGDRGVQLKTEADGRMFPVTDNSETIIRCLLSEAAQHRVEILMNRDVKAAYYENGKWNLRYASGENDQCELLRIACGGFPKASQFAWIEQLGHTVISPVPSLFTFNTPASPLNELMGVSVSGTVKIKGTKWSEEGPILITHWGLSGPAVLRLSARAARDLFGMDYRFEVLVNWYGGADAQDVRARLAELRSSSGGAKAMGRNSFGIPQRLWEYLCVKSGISEHTRWADLKAENQALLAKGLCTTELKVAGKTTYKEEFVTAGGISLPEIDHRTMGSKIKPGLYFAGEIMDVDGVTGGFNFQHAWTSGWVAGKAIASAGLLVFCLFSLAFFSYLCTPE
jgi:predicted Rossmann fold flavoprotein